MVQCSVRFDPHLRGRSCTAVRVVAVPRLSHAGTSRWFSVVKRREQMKTSRPEVSRPASRVGGVSRSVLRPGRQSESGLPSTAYNVVGELDGNYDRARSTPAGRPARFAPPSAVSSLETTAHPKRETTSRMKRFCEVPPSDSRPSTSCRTGPGNARTIADEEFRCARPSFPKHEARRCR